MSRRSRSTVLPLLLALAGCLAGWVWTIDYEFEAQAWRSDEGGVSELAAERADRTDLQAGDEAASFAVAVDPGAIELSVTNESPAEMVVELADARLVDAEGRELDLIVVGSERGAETGRRLPPGATLAVTVWPRAWADFEPTRGDSPIDGRLLVRERREEAEAAARDHVGKSIEIVLPVATEGRRATYRLRLTVARLVAKRISWA